MRQPDYKDRLLEIHGTNAWSGYHMGRAIELVKKFNLTDTIFHCNDIIGRTIKSGKYFPPNMSLPSYDDRDGDTKSHRYCLGDVIDKVTTTGPEFYVKIEEVHYPHEILQGFPYPREENGAVCPTEPFWQELLEEKVHELVQRFPKMSEIIVSVGTRKNTVSLAANKCERERCQCCGINL